MIYNYKPLDITSMGLISLKQSDDLFGNNEMYYWFLYFGIFSITLKSVIITGNGRHLSLY